MKAQLIHKLTHVCRALGLNNVAINLEYPESFEHGDFASNVALVNAKHIGLNPRELAEQIVREFKKELPEWIEAVTIAGPGFINFKIKDAVFAAEMAGLSAAGGHQVGGHKSRVAALFPVAGEAGKTIMVEFTDPNPFKLFHIGHLMSNAIGESIARLAEYNGATVKRANWQGDVGLHVAKTIWSVHKNGLNEFSAMEKVSLAEHVAFLGQAYAAGTVAYDQVDNKKEIDDLNKKIFDRSDAEINRIYDKGRQWSLDYFETIYRRLGTAFDYYFFESKEGVAGAQIVKEHMGMGIFENSEGAVVFKGEKYGLHTRVFINSLGLPTYEAKELGLNREKFQVEKKLDRSLIVTANEISDYFKVLLKVMELVYPEIAAKTEHVPHGMLRLTSGKMSSRTGTVIAAEELIGDIRDLVKKKIADRQFSPAETDEIADVVAVGAIKYSILRAAIGGDIVYDRESSVSFEGDSGPYLQYAAVRAASIREKAEKEGMSVKLTAAAAKKLRLPERVGHLERLISRFPDVVERAWREYAPQHVAGYLIALAGAFNSFYASQTIIDQNDPLSPYYLALTDVFRRTLTDGLWVLGIKVPNKM
jgi:arginyl-tRNA synthetase